MAMDSQPFISNYDSQSELQINAQIRKYLLETAKWSRFLAILAFILIGLMVVGAFTFGSFMNSMMSGVPGITSRMPGGSSVFMSVYLLIFAVLYFFPTLYLYQFATKTKKALLYGEALNLAFAFSRLKSFFKFWGILLIVFFGFYALLIIGYIIGATMLN